MSSRNRYLSAEERATAPLLHEVLVDIAQAGSHAERLMAIAEGRRRLETAGFTIDYLEVRDAETLRAAEPHEPRPLRALAAARLGATRLIDNVAVLGP
jgi:pantoate--beta-alanine ligase